MPRRVLIRKDQTEPNISKVISVPIDIAIQKWLELISPVNKLDRTMKDTKI